MKRILMCLVVVGGVILGVAIVGIFTHHQVACAMSIGTSCPPGLVRVLDVNCTMQDFDYELTYYTYDSIRQQCIRHVETGRLKWAGTGCPYYVGQTWPYTGGPIGWPIAN